MKKKQGYNKGDIYEDKIYEISLKRGILPKGFKRAGAAGFAPDIKFLHNGEEICLEIKANLQADYGQKMLKQNNKKWVWCVKDETTNFYTDLGILSLINKTKNFNSRRFTIPKEKLTPGDKNWDQRIFEDKITIPTDGLFNYYAQKNCFYMQIGGYGFYYLKEDILNLGVPQFDGKLFLRFRAKTIHSEPVWHYGFYAVLKVDTNNKPTSSTYDLEEKENRSFPPIKPA